MCMDGLVRLLMILATPRTKLIHTNRNAYYMLIMLILGYLDTWSGFEAAKTAPWPSRGLHHCGKFLEPSDE